ncbi:MAG: hypothetical protein GY903_18480 [Fuerstiella sp.]|nr:hypothetical protein [Fuerstiella sp.]
MDSIFNRSAETEANPHGISGLLSPTERLPRMTSLMTGRIRQLSATETKEAVEKYQNGKPGRYVS